ncbi:MAG: thiamine-phosphate kinase [Vicinamibacterales bacterium]
MTVAELGEHALLARLLARLPRPSAQVLVGPGDDAAVLAPVRNERLVVTTDAVVQGVHFSGAFSPADIGHKALAVNLSDLAAMAATPQWALLSLVLPDTWAVADVEGLVDGLAALATRHNVSVVGGNITRTTGPLVVDVTAGGTVASRKWLTRSGAVAGDEIWVSGTIGGAAAGLEMLGAAKPGIGNREPEVESAFPTPGCIERQLRPMPRVRLGIAMGRGRAARAAMDLSDGLADAVRQMAAASGCGARIDAAALPIEPGAAAWWQARGVDPIRAAIAGGEEYELLFAVPKRGGGRLRNVRRHVADPVLTRVGVFTKDANTVVVERDGREEVLPEGYRHFTERS